MSTKKKWAQIEYEKHAAELRKLFVPEPIQTWDELSDFLKEGWEQQFPGIIIEEIDRPN